MPQHVIINTMTSLSWWYWIDLWCKLIFFVHYDNIWRMDDGSIFDACGLWWCIYVDEGDGASCIMHHAWHLHLNHRARFLNGYTLLCYYDTWRYLIWNRLFILAVHYTIYAQIIYTRVYTDRACRDASIFAAISKTKTSRRLSMIIVRQKLFPYWWCCLCLWSIHDHAAQPQSV